MVANLSGSTLDYQSDRCWFEHLLRRLRRVNNCLNSKLGGGPEVWSNQKEGPGHTFDKLTFSVS